MDQDLDTSKQRLTLQDVATAGISKAINKRRKATSDPPDPLIFGSSHHSILPKATQADATQCGGAAAHRDDEEHEPDSVAPWRPGGAHSIMSDAALPYNTSLGDEGLTGVDAEPCCTFRGATLPFVGSRPQRTVLTNQ
jgi:hypothetical protein